MSSGAYCDDILRRLPKPLTTVRDWVSTFLLCENTGYLPAVFEFLVFEMLISSRVFGNKMIHTFPMGGHNSSSCRGILS